MRCLMQWDFAEDALVIEGDPAEEIRRQEGYIGVYLPKMQRTIFVNNTAGEATFVYKGKLEMEKFIRHGKQWLEFHLYEIDLYQDNIPWREKDIYAALLSGTDNLHEQVAIQDMQEARDDILRASFLEVYANLPPEEQNMITRAANSYVQRAKKYPHFPKSYVGLITLFGWDPTCMEWWYVKALLEGMGDDYLKKWEALHEIQKYTKEEFMQFYWDLPPEEQKCITSSAGSYFKRAKKYPKVQRTYESLIPFLWGEPRCQEGGYVEVLLEETVEEQVTYLQNRDKEQLQPKLTKEEFILFYNEFLDDEEKKNLSSSRRYEKWAPQYSEIPQSYRGLISLLEGDPTCQSWDHIKALIAGTAAEYLVKREKEKALPKFTKEDFIKQYITLPEEERVMISSSDTTYRKRAKAHPKFPQGYFQLILLFGGNPKCLEWAYIKVLLEGTAEEQAAYIHRREKRKLEKITTKDAFLSFYDTLSPEEKAIVVGNGNHYNRRAQAYPIPTCQQSLIRLLNGNPKCREWAQVKVLLEGTLEDRITYIQDREKRSSRQTKKREKALVE